MELIRLKNHRVPIGTLKENDKFCECEQAYHFGPSWVLKKSSHGDLYTHSDDLEVYIKQMIRPEDKSPVIPLTKEGKFPEGSFRLDPDYKEKPNQWFYFKGVLIFNHDGYGNFLQTFIQIPEDQQIPIVLTAPVSCWVEFAPRDQVLWAPIREVEK